MFDKVKSYFVHYRSERRGVIALTAILLSILLSVEIFHHFYQPEVKPLKIRFADSNFLLDQGKGRIEEDDLFHFNPNQLSDSGYYRLGFSEKEVNTLRNYQASGASFEVKKDFEKLYFVDSLEYRTLENYIDLPDSINSKPQKPPKYKHEQNPKVKWSDTALFRSYAYKPFKCNINSADTNELKRLKGVGSFYARKIVERRDELGGYHHLGQLLEIWKMTPEKIDQFADQVVIDLAELRKIQINQSTAQQLSQHPYLDFGLSSKVVLKREEIGRFKDMDELSKSGLLDAELCRKLAPYLKFD